MMKTRLQLAFAGLAIVLTGPAFALNFSGDVKALGEFNALGMKYEEAYNKNDAAALASLFAEDAVVGTPLELVFGRQAIEKMYADEFQKWHTTNHIGQADRLNAIGNEPWSVGEWWCTLQDQNGPVLVSGYWSAIYVREGDDWKFQMLNYNVTPPLAGTGTPASTTAPSN
jgi:ketosteroid isomerase-like protein